MQGEGSYSSSHALSVGSISFVCFVCHPPTGIFAGLTCRELCWFSTWLDFDWLQLHRFFFSSTFPKSCHLGTPILFENLNYKTVNRQLILGPACQINSLGSRDVIWPKKHQLKVLQMQIHLIEALVVDKVSREQLQAQTPSQSEAKFFSSNETSRQS